MAGRIISYLKKLFQKNESENYKFQVYSLEGLVLLIFKELSDLKQQEKLDKKAREDNNNKPQPGNFEDSSTKE